jgi:hypothetical protein
VNHLAEIPAGSDDHWPAHDRADLSAVPPAVDDPRREARPGTADAYAKPCVMVIGNVRDITTGSSSSGNKDANSQYYW